MRTFTTENRSTGILRNSINRQDTYGLISKIKLCCKSNWNYNSV